MYLPTRQGFDSYLVIKAVAHLRKICMCREMQEKLSCFYREYLTPMACALIQCVSTQMLPVLTRAAQVVANRQTECNT